MTPDALRESGDIIGGARVHLGERHVFIVSHISREIVSEVLEHAEASGELESRTLLL